MSIRSLLVDAILFDMDGTLIDSTPGLLKAWEIFARDYNLGDPNTVAHATHGMRLYDTLNQVCGIKDEDLLQSEIVRFEEEVIRGGPIALPGVASLLAQINDASTRPTWTIVTSATNFYAPRALERCSIPLPSPGLVTSNDVSNGKPHPEPYLAGAKKVGFEPAQCLVVEDAISGLTAGRNAGSSTLAVCTSSSREVIIASGIKPNYIATDLTKVSVKSVGDKLEVTIDESP